MLKAERLNKNLSLQDVATSLKLSTKLIASLEAGNLDELPAKTFVRGFVKSYAQFLRLDTDVVLRQFQEEMGSTSPLPKVPPPPPTSNITEAIKAPKPALKHTSQNYANKNPAAPQQANLNKENNSKKIAIMISGAVLLIIMLLIGNKLSESFHSDPIAEQAPPPSANSEDSTAAAIPTSKDTTAPLSVDQSVASNEVIPPPTVEDVVDSQTIINTDAPEAGFQKSTGKPIEIILEARKDTEVFYAKGDSKKFISLKIPANQIQILRSRVGLYLKTSDAGAVKLSVNGVDKGVAGANNKEVKLSF